MTSLQKARLVLAACHGLAAANAAELRVTIADAATGRTAAAVQLYGDDGTLHIPPQALDLGRMGFLYAAGALIHYADWKSPRARSQYPHFGSSWLRSQHPKDAACFFVDGEFVVELRPGHYRLHVSKGPEYIPLERTITINDGPLNESVTLSRWIDMGGRGWLSGDGHVHVERTSPESDAAVSWWARAEDVRVVNVLLMGDARQTYYPQYGYAPAGPPASNAVMLIPGQEDPRTRDLGHTLHFNVPRVLRDAAHYYDYGPVFAENRGAGLSGFAHVGRRRWSFQVERGLTLLVPAGGAHFVEIAQMGYIGVNLWYEFLNLGFRLTAMAGSDVPWGGSIGCTRVYAHTGGQPSADNWIAAVREGHTFVTTGPMLDLTVNGKLPGSVLRITRGERLRIQARAARASSDASPARLKLISFGDVIKEVAGPGTLTAELELQPEHSLWLTAQCETNAGQLMDAPGFFTGAVATPVFVEVDGQPVRHVRLMDELVARRLRTLDEIEAWLAAGTRTMDAGAVGGWESREALQASADAIRAQVRTARAFFTNLREGH